MKDNVDSSSSTNDNFFRLLLANYSYYAASSMYSWAEPLNGTSPRPKGTGESLDTDRCRVGKNHYGLWDTPVQIILG
ncbi:unnamed protein product [Dovyalis caffra]|uniref:Uncharacterized protein n=1 Tax=Dovyalis caffra TaxID=77055 RepID=A0AAV1S7D6_9ROSI|nr:unnamed protein product [Dovyalis caffra]